MKLKNLKNYLRDLCEDIQYWYENNIKAKIDSYKNYRNNCKLFKKELTQWNWCDYVYHTLMFIKMIETAERRLYNEGNEVDESRYQKCYQMRRLIKLLKDYDDYELALYSVVSRGEYEDKKFASGVKFPSMDEAYNYRDNIFEIYNVYIHKYKKLITDCLTHEKYGYQSWWD